MTDKLQKTVRAIGNALHRHGTVTVILDDEGKAHILPGFEVEVLGVYSQPCPLENIKADLMEVAK
ncbi:MAG: hypothetical protein HND55_08835 [Pseudomonadota bacterium]|nr:MAG: hypothetical protein HND55_08835 [Pseudomonadota bacterium]